MKQDNKDKEQAHIICATNQFPQNEKSHSGKHMWLIPKRRTAMKMPHRENVLQEAKIREGVMSLINNILVL